MKGLKIGDFVGGGVNRVSGTQGKSGKENSER